MNKTIHANPLYLCNVKFLYHDMSKGILDNPYPAATYPEYVESCFYDQLLLPVKLRSQFFYSSAVE